MRWLLPLALVVCACGASSAPVGESGACAAMTTFRGDVYIGIADDREFLPADEIGQATIAGCNDSNGPHEDDHQAEVRAIRGVDPLYAVFIGGELYQNSSTFPVLKSHPLYDRPVRAKMRGPRCRIAGRAERQMNGFTVSGRLVRVFTNTDVRVPRAYIPDGIPVVVTGRRCHRDFVSAERIDPA
jgi:hypothetical protein